MKKVEKVSKRFLKEINYELTWLNVYHYCERLGYKIHFFDENFVEDIIIKKLKIKLTGKEKGVVYDNSNHKYILIRNNLDEFTKLKTLLHECGHILLGHKLSMLRDEAREQEAEMFAIRVMRNCNKRFSFQKISLIAACVFFIVIAALCDKDNKNINAVTSAEESIVENESLDDDNSIESDAVLITRTGECYHASDCYTIKNSNVISISFYEAQKSYRPCKVCIK